MNKLDAPDLDRWRAGELPDEEMFNALQDALDFLLDPPTVKLRQTSNQSIPYNADTRIQWHEAIEDNCKPFGVGYTTAMWDPADPNKIICRVGGWYDITITTSWENLADDGSRRITETRLNGVTNPEHGRRDMWHTSNGTVTNMTWPVFFNVGDYCEAWVYHDHTGGIARSLVVGTEPGRRSQFKMKWVSL